MTNNFLVFWPSYCTYIRAISLLSLPSLPTKIAAVRIKENITSQKMIKKDLKKNLTDFL